MLPGELFRNETLKHTLWQSAAVLIVAGCPLVSLHGQSIPSTMYGFLEEWQVLQMNKTSPMKKSKVFAVSALTRVSAILNHSYSLTGVN